MREDDKREVGSFCTNDKGTRTDPKKKFAVTNDGFESCEAPESKFPKCSIYSG